MQIILYIYCIDFQLKKNRQKSTKTKKSILDDIVYTLQRFIVGRRIDKKVPRRKKSILEAAKSRLKNKKYYLINKKERKTLFKTE